MLSFEMTSTETRPFAGIDGPCQDQTGRHRYHNCLETDLNAALKNTLSSKEWCKPPTVQYLDDNMTARSHIIQRQLNFDAAKHVAD